MSARAISHPGTLSACLSFFLSVRSDFKEKKSEEASGVSVRPKRSKDPSLKFFNQSGGLPYLALMSVQKCP